MKFYKWIKYLDIVDFEFNTPELITYYLMRDNDLFGYERDILRDYAYMKCRHNDICRIKNEESIC